MKVIMVSRTFPVYHPKAGQQTHFVEKILVSLGFVDPIKWCDKTVPDPKHHTIRAGNRWKVGDMASLRYWSGKPYKSKQVEFAQVEIKKVWPIKIEVNTILVDTGVLWSYFSSKFNIDDMKEIATNDGLSVDDLKAWFKMPVKETFTGQVICWSDKVNY